LSSVCANKDLHKWASTVHHFDTEAEKGLEIFCDVESLIPLI